MIASSGPTQWHGKKQSDGSNWYEVEESHCNTYGITGSLACDKLHKTDFTFSDSN